MTMMTNISTFMDDTRDLSFLFASILLVLLCLWRFYWRDIRFIQLVDAIPGPPGIPLIGNLVFHAFKVKGWRITLDTLGHQKLIFQTFTKRYGGIWKGWSGKRCFVFLSSPELMEPILSSQTLIAKSRDYDAFKILIGNSLLVKSGDDWRTRRRLLTPTFHFTILESFFDILNERSQSLLVDFTNASCKATTLFSDPIDVCPMLRNVTLDIICDSAMGRHVKKRQENQVYLNSVHRITAIAMERVHKPWLLVDYFFNLSSIFQENEECKRNITFFNEKVIRERQSALKNNSNTFKTSDRKLNGSNITGNENKPSSRNKLAFLDLLIEASSEQRDGFSGKDIRNEVNLFMIAGQETTAVTLGWFLYCIARNQHDQEKLFKELDGVFGDNIERFCTLQDTTKLKYLECCIKETLRLYPSVPVIGRTINEDVKVGKYILPKNVTVILNIYAMHRNPLLYPNPETFKPERFQSLQKNDGSSTKSCRHPFAFIPFSAGPRNCIGQKYAMFELKVVLSWILRNFHFSLPSGPLSLDNEIDTSFEITLRPVGGIPLVVTPRKNVKKSMVSMYGADEKAL